jgi:hypothetical protein
MKNIIPFPVRHDPVVIHDLNFISFQKQLCSLTRQGYQVMTMNTLFKRTSFGGIVSYTASLEKA